MTNFEAIANGAARMVAQLYLINRTAMIPSFGTVIARQRGINFGTKLLNYGLSQVDDKTRDLIDQAFGAVKAQMGNALELLINNYKPEGAPTVEQVIDYINSHVSADGKERGIAALARDYMLQKYDEQRRDKKRLEEIAREGVETS